MPPESRRPRRSARGQAMAPATVSIDPHEAFERTDATILYWLGMGGFLLNSRGNLLAIDPVLQDFDMPLLIDLPLAVAQVPRLDAVLVTHVDNDHFSIPTCRQLLPVTRAYDSTRYVAQVMGDNGMPSHGHDIGDVFDVGDIRVEVTPADHAWQNAAPEPGQRWFQPEDCCGFWIETPDGTIWAPGDSRLIRDHHLTRPAPDVVLFDFSDNEWHFGFAGAVEIANAYPDSALVLQHWGSVDAPAFSPFNADPDELLASVVHPERVHVVAPGEPFTVTRVGS